MLLQKSSCFQLCYYKFYSDTDSEKFENWSIFDEVIWHTIKWAEFFWPPVYSCAMKVNSSILSIEQTLSRSMLRLHILGAWSYESNMHAC